MMQLAFTGFLFGAIAIIVPIILHLIKRKPTDETPFPSFMFIQKKIVAKQSRNNIRKWLILLLRCLAFLLLALAFAWPYLPNFAKHPKKATVILWDDSLSMSAKPYAEEMKSSVLKQLSKANDTHPIRLGIISDDTVWSKQFTGNGDKLKTFFKTTIATTETAPFELGLRQADSFLNDVIADKKEIILFTDRQKLSWQNVNFNNPLRSGAKLSLVFPTKTGFSNVAITSIKNLSRFSQPNKICTFQLTTKNYSTKNYSGKLSIFLDNKLISSKPITVQPSEKKEILFPLTLHKLKPYAIRCELNIDDDIEADNIRFFSLNPTKHPRLAINGTTGFDYVKLAYQPSPKNHVAQITPLTKPNIGRADFIILRKAIPLSTPKGESLLKAIQEGQKVVVIWDNSPAMKTFLLHFGIKTFSNHSDTTEHFGSIDFEHPLFSRFKNTKVGSFFDIAFFAPPKFRLPTTATRIASFDNGNPAIAEISFGKGSIILIATSFDRKSSNWCVHSTFLPFMRMVMHYCCSNKKVSTQYTVGDVIKTSQYKEIEETKTGKTVPATSIFSTTTPDCYLLKDETHKKMVSFNTPLEESNSQLLSKQFTVKSLQKTDKTVSSQQTPHSNLPPEQGKTFWWIVLLFAAIMMISELLLANRTAL